MIDISEIPELRNDYYTHIEWNGRVYPSLENAFQASKFYNPDMQKRFTTMAAAQAAAIGNIRKPPVKDWYKNEAKILYELLMVKFQDEKLKKILLDTNDKYLVYHNKYHDNVLGICTCKRCYNHAPFHNLLGKELMIVRDELREVQ